jgi:hypothetical protein
MHMDTNIIATIATINLVSTIDSPKEESCES